MIEEKAFQIKDELISIRRHLHRTPETDFEEIKTSAFIRSKLDEYGIPYTTSAKTGTVALIKGKNSNKTVLLRADIDGLPIKDESKYYIPTVEEINTIGVYGELPNGPSNVELVSSVVKENTGENKAARKVISNPTRIDDSIPWTFDNMGKRLVNQPVVKTKKVYPNDKCPCGSGKKYKYCCGR